MRGSDTHPLKSGAQGPIKAQVETAGECTMKLLDSGIRVFTLAQGSGVRWLKEELATLNVKTPLTDGCMEEMVRHADSAAWQALGVARGSNSSLT